MLGSADESHLRAHQRAMRGVERDQRIIAGGASGFTVGTHEHRGEARPATCGEVHDEECEVISDVELAQPGVELDAVHDEGGSVEEDVLGPQVSMSLTHSSRDRTLFK